MNTIIRTTKLTFGIWITAVLMSLPSIGYATTYLFWDGMVLAALNGEGQLIAPPETLSIGQSVNRSMARKIKNIWQYTEGQKNYGPERSSIVLGSTEGCSGSDSIRVGDSHPKGLSMSKNIAVRRTSREQQPTESEVKTATDRLTRLLLAQEKMQPSLLKGAVDTTTVQAIRFRSGEGNTLIATTHYETPNDPFFEVTAFLILTPLADGKYKTSFQEVTIATSMDSVSEWSPLMVIDLDGDGQDELIVSHSGYESMSYEIIVRQGTNWTVMPGIYAGAGC